MSYEPTLESLQQHEVPEWYHDAKLGLLIVWGVFSIPGWAPMTGDLDKVIAEQGWEAFFSKNPYAEWYMNTMQFEGSPTQEHHRERYGDDFHYDDFVPQFQEAVEKWDPDEWADLFAEAGVKYTVFLTKHHDGFLLWNSQHPNPYKPNYQTKRDVTGELADAVRKRDIDFGIYYSGGLDWSFNPGPIRDFAEVYGNVPQTDVYEQYATAHWRELIDRYRPTVMWNDIAYPANADLVTLFSDYLNVVPEGVINDRFAQFIPETDGTADEGIVAPPPSIFFDIRTPEYSQFSEIQEKKWETCRGIAHSFSYNMNENLDNALSVRELVHMLADIVSKNGNLLLSFGPQADGTVPDVQRDRLLGLGKWLKVNGEGIYGTRPWHIAEGSTDEEISVRFTQKPNVVYAILLGQPGTVVALKGLTAAAGTQIRCLGMSDTPLEWVQSEDGIRVTLEASRLDAVANTLKISPQPSVMG